MPRYCFNLQVRPELMGEYVERHRAVWPDMLHALKTSAWHNYSLFLRDAGLLEDPYTGARASIADTAVGSRWQTEMAQFFIGIDGRPPDESLLLLTEVFHLEDQLTQANPHQQLEEK